MTNLFFVFTEYWIITHLNSSNFSNGKSFYLYLLVFLFILFLFVVFAIVNIVFAIKCGIKNDIVKLNQCMKIVKFSSIPYFFINFICIGLLMTVLVAASRGFGIIYLPIPFILTWFVVLATSSYGIIELTILFKNNVITLKKYVFHLILQLCFVFDVISSIWIANKQKQIRTNSKSL